MDTTRLKLTNYYKQALTPPMLSAIRYLRCDMGYSWVAIANCMKQDYPELTIDVPAIAGEIMCQVAGIGVFHV